MSSFSRKFADLEITKIAKIRVIESQRKSEVILQTLLYNTSFLFLNKVKWRKIRRFSRFKKITRFDYNFRKITAGKFFNKFNYLNLFNYIEIYKCPSCLLPILITTEIEMCFHFVEKKET